MAADIGAKYVIQNSNRLRRWPVYQILSKMFKFLCSDKTWFYNIEMNWVYTIL